MDPIGIVASPSSAAPPARRSFHHWWPSLMIAALIAIIAGLIGVDLWRKASIDRSLAAILKAGGYYARDEASRDRPIVSIDLDSYLIDDSGRAHHRGQATDEVLAQLAPFAQLRDLTVEGSDVTDAGLALLARFQALRSLNLRRTRVSDACIPQLGRCQGLVRLDVSETRLSRLGVMSLQRALPETQIVSDFE
jgi:hypothetical protein